MAALRSWTDEQDGFIDDVVAGFNVVLNAFAGTGKTSAIVEAVKQLHRKQPHRTILLVTYNVRIKQEIEDRLKAALDVKNLPDVISVRTLNSIGFGVLLANQFCGNNKIETDAYKVQKMAKEALSEGVVRSIMRDAAARVPAEKGKRKVILDDRDFEVLLEEIVTLAKLYGHRPEAINLKTLEVLINVAGDKAGLGSPMKATEGMVKLITNLLTYNIDLGRHGHIDFNDQIYLAALYCNHPGKQWMTVFNDEFQDCSFLHNVLVKRASRNQLVFAGDEFQNIFQSVTNSTVEPVKRFAADAKSKAKEHEFTLTFRCARVIAERQVEFGPLASFKPALGVKAPLGTLVFPYLGKEFPGWPTKMRGNLRPSWNFKELATRKGSTVFLSGTNACLIEAMALAHVDKTKLVQRVVYCGQVYPQTRWTAANAYTAAPSQAPSNIMSAMAFFLTVTGMSPQEACQYFSDRRSEIASEEKVIFSTVHSFKGREADSVFLIEPANLAKDENLKYVAETRARTALHTLNLGHHSSVQKNKAVARYLINTNRPTEAIPAQQLLTDIRREIPTRFRQDREAVLDSISEGEEPCFIRKPKPKKKTKKKKAHARRASL